MDGIALLFTSFIVLVSICIGEAGRLSSFTPPEPQPEEEPTIDLPGGTWAALKGLVNARKGESMRGVTELKHYLHSFGYLLAQVPVRNFTDCYDDRVESAVKLYQHSFDLPVTGNIDEETLSQIMTPRCGVADIIDGTSTMVAPNRSHSRPALDSTVKHYSFFNGTPKWPPGKRNLTYAFSPLNKSLGIDQAQVQTAFSRAFKRWAAVIPVTFTATKNYSGADIKIGFFSGYHGDGQPFDGPLGTLGHAFSPQNGRLHMDADERWSFNLEEEDTSDAKAIDLESIATHEIGHILGLGHSSVKGTVMFPTISPRTRKVDLTYDDVYGAQALYGPNPNFDPSLVSFDAADQFTQNTAPPLPLLHTISFYFFLTSTSFLCVFSCGGFIILHLL